MPKGWRREAAFDSGFVAATLFAGSWNSAYDRFHSCPRVRCIRLSGVRFTGQLSAVSFAAVPKAGTR